ncbi:MAG: regulatory protein YycI of two-component signal transduction system YycFG [Paraglaciecola sp.]|jgi:regulatory protein YycI of two-component signal transduction system YycFG
MSTWAIIAIFVFVLGIILGNIMLLKQSAKHKFPEVKKDNNEAFDDNDDDWPKS